MSETAYTVSVNRSHKRKSARLMETYEFALFSHSAYLLQIRDLPVAESL